MRVSVSPCTPAELAPPIARVMLCQCRTMTTGVSPRHGATPRFIAKSSHASTVVPGQITTYGSCPAGRLDGLRPIRSHPRHSTRHPGARTPDHRAAAAAVVSILRLQDDGLQCDATVLCHHRTTTPASDADNYFHCAGAGDHGHHAGDHRTSAHDVHARHGPATSGARCASDM